MVRMRLARFSKWKPNVAARGGERHLHSVPGDKDGGEHAKEILAHGVEEAEILREHVVDGLIDELQKVSLHLVGSFDVSGIGYV